MCKLISKIFRWNKGPCSGENLLKKRASKPICLHIEKPQNVYCGFDSPEKDCRPKKTKNPGSHEWKSRSGWLCRRMGGFRRLAPVWNNSNTRWVIKIFKVFNLITDIKAFGGGCAQYLNIWALILVLSQHVFGSSRNFIIRGSRICMLSYNLEASGKTNVSKNWRTNGTQWFFL